MAEIGIVDAWAQMPVRGDQLVPESGDCWSARGPPRCANRCRRGGDDRSMDGAGERLMICAWSRPGQWVITNDEVAVLVAAHPDRFIGVAAVDLQHPMVAVRELERAVSKLGLRALRVIPWLWDCPPDDRLYYPHYARCVELGIPFCTQIGHTGPAMPSEPGRPIPYLDRVALDFPELVIVAGHTGHPWTEEAIGLAWKHDNLLSRHLRPCAPLLHRGKTPLHRDLRLRESALGTNCPRLPLERCAAEARALNLPDEARQRSSGPAPSACPGCPRAMGGNQAFPRSGQPVRGSQTGRPIMALLDLVGRRWTLRVTWELHTSQPQPLTFRALQDRCGAISSSVLNRRLVTCVTPGSSRARRAAASSPRWAPTGSSCCRPSMPGRSDGALTPKGPQDRARSRGSQVRRTVTLLTANERGTELRIRAP